MSVVDKMARVVKRKPHSFDHIRKATGLEMSDAEFTSLVEQFPSRFQLTRFVRWDDEGQRLRPGRPGVKLRAAGVA